MKIRAFNPSTVIAVIALLFSLTGTAVAGALVTGANVKNGSLSGLDVKNGSLGSVDIKNGSIKPVDIKGGVFPTGPQGPEGPQGPQGPGGPQGPAGLSGLQIVNAFSAFNSASYKFAFATCPAGNQEGRRRRSLRRRRPEGDRDRRDYPLSTTTWFASAHELPAVYLASWRIRAYAICANVAA